MQGFAKFVAACAGSWAVWACSAGLSAAENQPLAAPASRIAWGALTRSVEDRVIEYCRFGAGDEHVLVVAPLAGDEFEGVELAERLASHLEQFPRRLSETTVTIVRDPNPDGRFHRTAANARGVLLDQNFRTRHWRKYPLGDRWLSGREPESEPETRALADLLDDLKPSRVIVLGSSRRPGVLNYAGPAEPIALRVAELAQMKPMPLVAADAAGALAALAGFDRGIATLVFRVPARSTVERNWSSYKRALLAALDGPSQTSAAENRGAEEHAAEQTALETNSPEPRRLSAAAIPIAIKSAASSHATQAANPSSGASGALSPEEMQKGLVLVPLGRPPGGPKTAERKPSATRQGGPAVGPKSATSQIPGVNASQTPGTLNLGQSLFAPAPNVGRWRPKPQDNEPGQSPASPAASPATAQPSRPNFQRLPPVDRQETRPPAPRKQRQEPIPFYPRTGL